MEDRQKLLFGRFVIDRSRQVIRVGDREATLRPQSFEVLCYLAERAGRIVSKDELIQAVWKRRPASDDSLMQCVKDIRQAFGEDGHDAIRTVAKRGYLFTLQVTPAPVNVTASSSLPRPGKSESRRGRRWGASGRQILTSATAVLVIFASALALSRDQPSVRTERMTLMAAPSVTVLPFTRTTELSGHGDYFSSLAVNISTELAAMGRGYTILVKTVEAGNADRGLAALGSLDTRYAVLGSVQAGLSKTDINIRLIETANNQLVWGQMFADVSAQSDEASLIATRVANLIAMQLLAAESRRPLADKPSADDLAILGRARLVGERGAKANHDAHALFEQGLALDPNSVTALLGLARTNLDDVLNGWAPVADRAGLLDRADAMIRRVIELEPRSREAHLQRGILSRARKDIEQAIAAFEHTLELSPRYPHAHAELGRALIEEGRAEEAVTRIQEAIRLSPTDSALYIWCLWAGMAAVHAGDYEAALDWLRRAWHANHDFENTLIWLALAHAGRGQTKEAQTYLADFLAIRPQFTVSRWALGPPYRNQIVAHQRERITELMLHIGVRRGEAEAHSARTLLRP